MTHDQWLLQFGDFGKYPVGARVCVKHTVVDFNFFRGDETGTVKKNDGTYLGIIVKFDQPRHFKDGTVQKKFNFNPNDLRLLDDTLYHLETYFASTGIGIDD